MRVGVLDFDSNLFNATDVAEQLRHVGVDADAGPRENELRSGDVLLSISALRPTERLRSLLSSARKRGVRCIHWQYEVLLPPELPAWVRRLVESPSGLDVGTGSRLIRRFQDAQHAITFARVAHASRNRAWSPGYLGSHAFKLPLLQTRTLVNFWRESLLDEIFVSVAVRRKTLAEYGIPSSVVPVGYLPKMGDRLEGERRDIDVLFIGHVSSRRARMLWAIERRLKRAGFSVHVETASFGDERTALLNRSKIVLNIHKFPWEFPGMRLSMAMACGAVVVSETAPETTPYVDGEHFFEASADMIPGVLLNVLADESRRQAVAERTYRFATETLAMGPLLARALQNRTVTDGKQRR